MGMSYPEMRRATMFELNRKLEGLADREEAEWNRLRTLASMLLQPHLRKGTRLKPQDLIELPSDKHIRASPPRMSEAERREEVNHAMQIWRKRLGSGSDPSR